MGHPARREGLERLPGDVQDRIGRLPAHLEAEGVLVAYLFGSLVEDDEPRQPNDVDLALLMEDGAVWPLRDRLRNLLGTQRLDLVDLSTADPVLRFESSARGVPSTGATTTP